MASQRPPSGIARPMSRSGSAVPGAGRPPTAVRPPPTAIRVPTGMVPTTSGHPGMRGAIPSPGVLSAAIKVADRPVTQQGLSGMKTGMKGPQRQILDKSYYLGLLRSKINELTTETSKLHKEIENYNQENSVYVSYEKRAEGLAAEIKDLQGQLADYNMLVDKLNTNTEMEEMINDYNMLKAQNDIEARSIDSIFTERREREEVLRAIEEEIRRERQVAEEVVQAMPSAKRDKYFSMTTANEELLQELAVLQEELDVLVTRKEDYEAELSHSQIKQEMVRLHETLASLEGKRNAMEDEHRSLGSPQEEREKLLKQVKEDNQEIASMERQLTEIRDRKRQISEDIRNLDQDSEAAQGECQQKYKELKRKEEEIDRFLDSFEESRAEEQEKLTRSQEDIVSLLEHCSRNMLRLRHVDTVTASELKNMQEVLVSKETEVVQSESTARGLTTESRRLQQDLEKVQQLEGKISAELSTLKEQVSTMETELLTYRDLDALRRSADDKRKRLQEERLTLSQRRDFFLQLLEEMNQKHEALKTKLQENETHAQLTNLERKWQHLEQNNFVMKEFIASKTQESDYESVAKVVYQQVADYNKSLVEALQNNRN
ncbi:intraflagellar transport protein 74 homolog isoform X1 [Poecilia reticulata]|uniref:Intraflagellar transport 74 n=2 Tax=Poecilia reticulata TaxID=8081 RepID=A0A3P9P6H0_POERE|nr:PREDICTED: intraflagellar transport protein 74 homolog isoform X1 [Poecilia reticulata]XP_008436700.1 PREDICTED: intraflagellar transport protein 74 homolog isoform X1 [Poecilia reticulata]XP_008436701.1 PREDICTED: intraflagellar transport protein 74 homolog isoform X1 [Poecilia reticulata]